MEVDQSSAAAAAAIAKRKNEAEFEEQRARSDMARAARDNKKLIESERDKGEQLLVEISKEANNQVEQVKKINSDRVRSVNENTQKHYQELAAKTAEEIKRVDAESFNTIQDRKAASIEKIKNVTDQSEDPFYRMKTLSPAFSESEHAYSISVKLPEHEAKNLLVSAEGPYVKLTLARRYQDNLKSEEEGRERNTRTNSYQSVVEQIAMPGGYDPKKIERVYKDGALSIVLPKVQYGEKKKV